MVRALEKKPGLVVLTQTRQQLDLTDTGAVDRWFAKEKPEQVIDAAAGWAGFWKMRAGPWSSFWKICESKTM